MASSSSEKNLEDKQPEKPASGVPTHKSLPMAAVERMKQMKNWGEKFWLSYDEEKIRRVNEIQESLDINDLLWYVTHGDGEEVVWNDDVWNVQSIKEVPEYREAKRLKTAPKEVVAEPSILASEKPLDEDVAEKPLDNGNA